MKKRWIWIVAVLLLLAVLFVPIPTGVCRDGGTKTYTALTYKLVNWRRLTDSGLYEATKIYWFPENLKDLEELWAAEEPPEETFDFVATVLELEGNHALVQPVAGEEELRSADKLYVGLQKLDDIGAQVGSEVQVWYTGGIMETYPAQINAVKWQLAKDLRHRDYDGQWLDGEQSAPYEGEQSYELVITEIYADCFFAEPVIPMPYTVKLNGQLDGQWCVGDQVRCTCSGVRMGEDGSRMEAELLTVEVSDWAPEPGVAYKPVIYLYPQEKTRVSVKLMLDGELTCTYPAYNRGWEVTAAADGTLTDASGQTYNYLYWEGETNARWDMTEGFCVKGRDTAAFLEQALAKLGLTRREANEFIVYWLPLMERNPYNIISFQSAAYTDAAVLQIDPAPDTLIRVFMAWSAAEAFVDLPPQALETVERTGFTVVEWGGTELTN